MFSTLLDKKKLNKKKTNLILTHVFFVSKIFSINIQCQEAENLYSQ